MQASRCCSNYMFLCVLVQFYKEFRAVELCILYLETISDVSLVFLCPQSVI